MTSIDDILMMFALEGKMGPQKLKTYLGRYPQHASKLLEAYNEFMLVEAEANDDDVCEIASKEVIDSHAVERVVEALYGKGVKELARKLSLPRSFLANLNASVVKIGSIPLGVFKVFSRELDVRTQDIIDAMRGNARSSFAFKADGKPSAGEPIEFTDYVASAQLDDAQRADLEIMVKADGQV